MALTLYDKIWQAHVIQEYEYGSSLLYIDRHLIHEVTSPLAFDAMRRKAIAVRRPRQTLSVVDHNIPTTARTLPIEDELSALQIRTLEKNTEDFGILSFNAHDKRQGIVHVVGPEQGFILPGMTVVCGDSHTATNGAFGALAHGIGSSEVEHVLATQTLVQKKAKNLRVTVNGALPVGVTAKDVALAIIRMLGAAGGVGHVIEYGGEAITAMSMEERMTVCNMTIEAGAKAGLIAPDRKTFDYLKGRPFAPSGAVWTAALSAWSALKSDADALFDAEYVLNASDIAPLVTWGTSSEDVIAITDAIPSAADFTGEDKRNAVKRSLDYMDLTPGMAATDIEISHVFIGSCTNSRIEDLRSAAKIARGRKVAQGVSAIVVPGSGLVKRQAEQDGLDQVFIAAGFEWREPGCSMCLGMNPDRLSPGDRCASTSNRNFEGRQGKQSRTHLVSPAMAAAAAIAGRLADVRDFSENG